MILAENKKTKKQYTFTEIEWQAAIDNGINIKYNVLNRKFEAKSDSTVVVMSFVKSAKERAKQNEIKEEKGVIIQEEKQEIIPELQEKQIEFDAGIPVLEENQDVKVEIQTQKRQYNKRPKQ